MTGRPTDRRSDHPTSDAYVVLQALRDPSGRITDFAVTALNERALARFDGEDPLHRTLRTVLSADHAEELIATCTHVCDTRSALCRSALECAPQPGGAGDGHYFDVRVVPLHDGVAFHWRDTILASAEGGVLAEAERRYRLLAENASDVVCLTDGDDRIVWVSPSITRMSGFSPDDVLGHSVSWWIEPADLPRALDARERVIAGSSETIELRLRHADGQPLWASCRAHPLLDEGRLAGTVLGIRDISEEMDVREQLRESEHRYREMAEQYRQLVESASDAVMRTREGVILWTSSPITEILGYTPDELVGRVTDELIHPDDLAALRLGRSDIDTGLEVGSRFRALARDGDYRWIDIRARPYRTPQGSIDGVVSVIRAIDADVAERRALEYDATHDPLTGLANRSAAVALLDTLHRRTPRTGHEVAVLFCDIDRFKQVNDTWGHAAGDTVLTVTAQRMAALVRSTDLVARLGGDELLVVLDGVHDEEDAVAMADRLRDVVAQPIDTGGHSIVVTLSVGVALARTDDDVARLLERADSALYASKDNGRDRIEVAR